MHFFLKIVHIYLYKMAEEDVLQVALNDAVAEVCTNTDDSEGHSEQVMPIVTASSPRVIKAIAAYVTADKKFKGNEKDLISKCYQRVFGLRVLFSASMTYLQVRVQTDKLPDTATLAQQCKDHAKEEKVAKKALKAAEDKVTAAEQSLKRARAAIAEYKEDVSKKTKLAATTKSASMLQRCATGDCTTKEMQAVSATYGVPVTDHSQLIQYGFDTIVNAK